MFKSKNCFIKMSKKRAISHVIEEEYEENKRPKRKVTLENNKKYKDYVEYDEETLSDSLSSLSISDESSSFIEEIEDEYNPTQTECIDYKSILVDENPIQLDSLSNELSLICNNLNDKKVTLTKILQSHLQSYEKERAVELFGVLADMARNELSNTLMYIQLNDILHNMISTSSLQSKNEDINKKLKELHDKMIFDTPTLDKIMNAPISETDRMMAIEQFNTFYHLGLSSEGLYSHEWFILRKKINMIIDRKIRDKQEYENLEKKEDEIKKYELDEHNDLKKKI